MPDFGDGSPRENYGTVDPYAPSVANGGITPEQWAEYQKKRRRAAILGILGTVGGASAAGVLGSALGGGGGAGAASGIGAGEFSLSTTPYLGSAAVGAPAAASGVGAGAATAAGSAGLASAAGGGTSAGGAATGAAGAAGASRGIIGGLTMQDLMALGSVGATAIGAATQDTPNMNPTTQTTDPNLLKLIQTMQGRLDKSEPLYGSILDMANGLLPTQYQKGGGGMP